MSESYARSLDAEYRTDCAALHTDEPWFAAFDAFVIGKERHYKLGSIRHPDSRIVDWRHPLAEIYYNRRPGEPFATQEDGPPGQRYSPLSGTLERKAAVTAGDRRLREVRLVTREGSTTLVATESGFGTPEEALGPRVAQRGLPDILALITPEQYQLITASRHAPVILQGRAGSGKTTVALYRVSWLASPDAIPDAAPVDPARTLIVMFNRALRTYIEQSLGPLGLSGVNVDTFHGWALDAIRRAYRGDIEPDPTEREGKTDAVAIKKQLGVLRALEEFVQLQTNAMEEWLTEKLASYRGEPWLEQVRSDGRPVVRRLYSAKRSAMAARDQARGKEQQRLEQIVQILNNAIRRMTQYKEELLKFCCSSELLARHLTNVTSEQLGALARYQRALQGDGGTDRRPGPKVAFEDFALLLRLLQLKHGGFPDKDQEDEASLFDHLVVDEAQDFGAVELTALLASVRSRTGVTIVGDVNQKIVPEADFIGWDALAAELGITGAAVARLEVAHRSTGPILALAESLTPSADGTAAVWGRPGSLPTLTLVDDEASLLTELASSCRAELADEPSAHVCVVCRGAKRAASLAQQLAAALPGLPVRLGHNKTFAFEPGVTVTNHRQVKGLEFDTVLLADPNVDGFPATEQARRDLYTIITRAKDRLHLVCTGAPSGLLDRARQDGLLEVIDRTQVEPVTFTEDEGEPF